MDYSKDPAKCLRCTDCGEVEGTHAANCIKLRERNYRPPVPPWKQPKKPTAEKAAKFCAELVKILPGYDWTVHKSGAPEIYLNATGTQSSGSNRLSTIDVTRRDPAQGRTVVWYEVKSAGHGLRAPWLAERGGATLAQALRALQKHYEHMAQKYSSHARYLQSARKVEP